MTWATTRFETLCDDRPLYAKNQLLLLLLHWTYLYSSPANTPILETAHTTQSQENAYYLVTRALCALKINDVTKVNINFVYFLP